MTTDIKERRLPSGIQSFEMIRNNGYLYVDKTDLIWKIANGDAFNYLSRPRRFGKSLLLNTLKCYFEGKKEFFRGLKISHLEKEWKQYPVIKLDMSGSGETEKGLRSYLDNTFARYEKEYNLEVRDNSDYTSRFQGIILAAREKTGLPAVVLVDEYDYPLQHSWGTPEHEACASIYRSVFTVLKMETDSLRFVFLTGVAKFTKISLFSALNNLSNISFYPEYAAVCGITDEELVADFQPEMKKMAEKKGCTVEEVHSQLKAFYDGYHFSEGNMVNVYNPFSLIKSLSEGKLRSYWVSSGATTMLNKFIKDLDIDIERLGHSSIDMDTLETSDINSGIAEVFLFQTGYLTIKSVEGEEFILGYPNKEVRTAMYQTVLPLLTDYQRRNNNISYNSLRSNINKGFVDEAMKCLKAVVADVPYSNKRLEAMYVEERYRFIISVILRSLGFRVDIEYTMAGGKADMVVYTSKDIYVIELKRTTEGGLAAAEKQILSCNYAEPFKAEGKPVIALAVEIEDEGKGILSWKIV